MRTSLSVITVLIISLAGSVLCAQDVIEVENKELSPIYLETLSKLDSLRTSPDRAINLLTDALPKITEPYERFDLIYWKLATLFCETKKYREAFNILKKGQSEGLFYVLIIGGIKFPPYIINLEKFDDFQSFLDENRRLSDAAEKTAKFEYFVRLPRNYSNNKKYPLIIILHEGFGNNFKETQNWHSPKLESDYITVYTQGDRLMGSFLRNYQRDSDSQFATAYRQIVNKYSVDTTQVLIGAQSAGAREAFKLTLEEIIPVKGVILAIPSMPQMDDVKIKKAADRGVKLYILAGKNTAEISRTKEAVKKFNKHGLQNHFVIFPGKEYELPDKFPAQIDISLDYLR